MTFTGHLEIFNIDQKNFSLLSVYYGLVFLTCMVHCVIPKNFRFISGSRLRLSLVIPLFCVLVGPFLESQSVSNNNFLWLSLVIIISTLIGHLEEKSILVDVITFSVLITGTLLTSVIMNGTQGLLTDSAVVVFITIGSFLLRLHEISGKTQPITWWSYACYPVMCALMLQGHFLSAVFLLVLSSLNLVFTSYHDAVCSAMIGGATFIWWQSLTNSSTSQAVISEVSLTLLSIAFFVVVKNSVRRLFFVLPVHWLASTQAAQDDLRNKIMFLLEHSLFAVWAYYEIVILPEGGGVDGTTKSWLLHTAVCWTYPAMPSDSFHLFIVTKTGTHVEDLLFIAYPILVNKLSRHFPSLFNSGATSGLTSSKQHVSTANGLDAATSAEAIQVCCPTSGVCSVMAHEKEKNEDSEDINAVNKASSTKGGSAKAVSSSTASGGGGHRDVMMDVHHIITALLCISSFVSGYVKIASLVMLLHDISDVPLDVLRIVMALKWDKLQIPVFLVVLLSWAYWRLWILPTVVLRTIMFESRSFLFPCTENCFYQLNAERGVFVIAIGVLLTLHFVWFWKMLKKGYREVFGK